MEKLLPLLKSFLGLSWSLSPENILQIEGRLHRIYDLIKLAELSKKTGLNYEFKALVDEDLKKPLEDYLKKEFEDQFLMEIDFDDLPFVFVRKSKIPLAKKKLRLFGFKVKEDPLWLDPSSFIEIEMAVVESVKTSGQSMGGEVEDLSLFSNLLSFLNFLKSSGGGRTLHHSKVVGQSGEKLEMSLGGQIPYKELDLKTLSQGSSWKSHGFELDILPRVGKKGFIELDLKAEISEPLPSTERSSPPPLKTKNFKNKFILKNNQILKIFEMKKESLSKTHNLGAGFALKNLAEMGRHARQIKLTHSVFLQVRKKEEKEEDKMSLEEL